MKNQLPKLTIQYRVCIKGEPDIIYTCEDLMPQDRMDQFQALVGDGKAQVNIGLPMGLKEFGTGSEAIVFISLTCNQDQQTVHTAVSLATEAVLYYTKQNLARGLAEVDQIIAQRKSAQLQANNGPRYG